MTINEYEAFLKWHFENWKLNCAHSDSIEEARKIYDRIYQNNKPNHIAERERGFMAWKAGKAQALQAWISVKEQLPELETEVLVVFKGNIIQAGLYQGEEGLAWWSELLDGWDLDFEKVTCWKPLIELPSKSGAEQ